MDRKRFQLEQTISKLREAEVLLAKGDTVGQGTTGFSMIQKPSIRKNGSATRRRWVWIGVPLKTAWNPERRLPRWNRI